MKKILFPLTLDRPGNSISTVFRNIAKNLEEWKVISYKQTDELKLKNAKLIKTTKNKYLQAIHITFSTLANLHNFNAAHFPPNAALIPLFLLLKILRKKTIYTVHENVLETKKLSLIQRFAISYFIKHSDKITCVSNFVKKGIEKYFNREPEVIYNGINLEDLKKSEIDIKKYFRINNKKPIVLFVGTLRQIKGIDIFLKIAKKHPELNFIMVGNGPLLSQVKKETKSMTNVYHNEYFPYNKIRELYSQSDVFLFPGKGEAFGLVYLEAIACNTPIVALKKGASPEIVSSKTGILCDNEEQLIDALKQVINGKFTYSKSEAKKIIQKFSWKKISKTYEKEYNK